MRPEPSADPPDGQPRRLQGLCRALLQITLAVGLLIGVWQFAGYVARHTGTRGFITDTRATFDREVPRVQRELTAAQDAGDRELFQRFGVSPLYRYTTMICGVDPPSGFGGYTQKCEVTAISAYPPVPQEAIREFPGAKTGPLGEPISPYADGSSPCSSWRNNYEKGIEVGGGNALECLGQRVGRSFDSSSRVRRVDLEGNQSGVPVTDGLFVIDVSYIELPGVPCRGWFEIMTCPPVTLDPIVP